MCCAHVPSWTRSPAMPFVQIGLKLVQHRTKARKANAVPWAPLSPMALLPLQVPSRAGVRPAVTDHPGQRGAEYSPTEGLLHAAALAQGSSSLQDSLHDCLSKTRPQFWIIWARTGKPKRVSPQTEPRSRPGSWLQASVMPRSEKRNPREEPSHLSEGLIWCIISSDAGKDSFVFRAAVGPPPKTRCFAPQNQV